MRRDLALGVGISVAVLWLTFFGTTGAVEVATLVVAVFALIWFASVPAERLVDSRRRPQVMLFGLTTLGAAVVLVAATIISTGTLLLTGLLTVVATVVGVWRAIRFGLVPDGQDP